MFKVDIDITATTWDEIEFALDEVKRKISQEYTGGNDSREDGITSYMYAITGEESKSVECKHCGNNVYWEEELPNTCDNCGEEM